MLNPNESAPLSGPESLARFLLVALALALFAGIVLEAFSFSPAGPVRAQAVGFAWSAKEFLDLIVADWLQAGNSFGDIGAAFSQSGQSIARLRWYEGADSLLVVPGYYGLLIFFGRGYARLAGARSALIQHLLCVPPVAAMVLHLAQTGMTLHAADDLLSVVLPDAEVEDVMLAAFIRWALTAMTLLVVGFAGFAAAVAAKIDRRSRIFMACGPVFALVAAAMILGELLPSTPDPFWGGCLSLVSLVAMVIWRISRSTTDRPSPVVDLWEFLLQIMGLRSEGNRTAPAGG
jgi:hypothetical protein